jgi:hypothetical protein
MYQDDYINDFINEDFDDNKLTNKKMFEDMKKTDPGYVSWKINVPGSTKPVKVDIRVIATSNRDLAQAVKDGTFREDLLYRLNVVNLRLPPLRERPADILALAEFFANCADRARVVKHAACYFGDRPARRGQADDSVAATHQYVYAQFTFER